jgi:hypothetical protein
MIKRIGFSGFDVTLSVTFVAFVLWMISVGPNGSIF